jgi:hypothetical protein
MLSLIITHPILMPNIKCLDLYVHISNSTGRLLLSKNTQWYLVKDMNIQIIHHMLLCIPLFLKLVVTWLRLIQNNVVPHIIF